MKNLFCKKLAACLCMKRPPSPSVEPVPNMKTQHVATGDRCSNRLIEHDDSTPSSPTTGTDSVKELLKEIRDLLKTRSDNEKEQSHEADKEDEMKNDWMLAAAVLDRICAIAFTVVFAGVTFIFVILFIVHL